MSPRRQTSPIAFVLAALAVLAGLGVSGSSPAAASGAASAPSAAPTVTHLSLHRGRLGGGERMTVTGTNFTQGHFESVLVGGSPAPHVQSVTPTSVVLLMPRRAAGPVNVQVVTDRGPSAATAASRFTYVDLPASTIGWGAPNLADPSAGRPTDVSCASTAFCVAVDQNGNAVEWHSGVWSRPTQVDRSGFGWFDAVSCVSATSCLAVGGLEAYAFDGHTWTQAGEQPLDEVMDVSCASPTFCVVVNLDGQVAVWDGTSWSSITDTHTVELSAVSCPSVGVCTAVGWDYATRLSGGVWTRTTIDPQEGLTGVSCADDTHCLAVNEKGQYAAYAGGTWSALRSVADDVLGPISCASPTSCVAIGRHAHLYRWDGSTWASEAGPPITLLNRSVDCASVPMCLQVGGYGYGSAWDGSTWSTKVLMDPPHGNPTAVSCASASDCTLVDAQGAAGHYDGTWAAAQPVDRPGLRGGGEGFTSVSCPTSSFCAAVDQLGDALTKSGGGWSAPRDLSHGWSLVGVSCPTATFCVTVGERGRAWIFRGGSWGSAERIDVRGRLLRAVSCASPTDCVVSDNAGNLLSYNGTGWSTDHLGDHVDLVSLSCPTTAFCAAVDSDGSVLTRSGSTWGAKTGVDNAGLLTAVSCGSAAYCVAVDTEGRVVSFNGSTWSRPTRVDLDDHASLAGVSCVASRECVMVDDLGHAFRTT